MQYLYISTVSQFVNKNIMLNDFLQSFTVPLFRWHLFM